MSDRSAAGAGIDLQDNTEARKSRRASISEPETHAPRQDVESKRSRRHSTSRYFNPPDPPSYIVTSTSEKLPRRQKLTVDDDPYANPPHLVKTNSEGIPRRSKD